MVIDRAVWQRHALANRFQSLLLLLVMALFLSLLGWLLLGGTGIFWLLLPGMLLLLFNPVASPWIIMRMYRASPLTQSPLLVSAVQELSRRAGLRQVPELFYIPSSSFNAFTVGMRNEAVIAVSDGLLRMLNSREMVAVLAHELSHIRNNDIWVMGVADLFSRLTSLLSIFGQFLLLLNLPLILFTEVSINWLVVLLLIFAPTMSALAQLGLSRTREYDADLGSVELTGDPEALASALLKLERQGASLFEQVFLPGRRMPEPSLLRTHPPTEERVRRLLALKPSINQPMSLEGLSQDNTLGYRVRRSPRWHVNGLWH